MSTTFINVGKFEKRKSSSDVLFAIEDMSIKNSLDINLIVSWNNPFIHDGFPFYLFNSRGYTSKEENGIYFFNKEKLNVISLPYMKSYKSTIYISRTLYAEAIFASKAEGFNLPLHEFASYNVPIICTDIPVHMEYMDTNAKIKSPFLEKAEDGQFFHGEGKWHYVDKDLILNILETPYIMGLRPIQSKLTKNYTWQRSANQIIQEMAPLL